MLRVEVPLPRATELTLAFFTNRKERAVIVVYIERNWSRVLRTDRGVHGSGWRESDSSDNGSLKTKW